MKFLLILLVLSTCFAGTLLLELKCKNEGCYEAIKLFAELLEKKINETDAVLSEAENELNEISYGNDEIFKEKIKEVDEKLTKLIVDLNVGVDGGDKTLFQLINSVFEDVEKIESRTEDVETNAESLEKTSETVDNNIDDTQEIIREIQAELNRLLNATTQTGPEALQNAFDRSQKFTTDSSQLKDTLEEVKLILKDYEENLINAKRLTLQAITKFAEVSKHVDQTMEEQKAVDDKLSDTSDLKTSENELKNIKKLAREALEQANKVFDEAFDLLNEVTKFEFNDKLDEINEKVEKLNDHSDSTNVELKKFADENSKFLDEMEKIVDDAEIAEQKAFQLQTDIENAIEAIKAVQDDALRAIADKDKIIADAKDIYNSLENFTLKVEKSRENARIALEKIPEIMKKIVDSVKIVENLENRLSNSTKAATDAKQKCETAKKQMDEILEESEDIKARINELESDFEDVPGDISSGNKEATRITKEIDNLEVNEAEDSKLIETTKEKIENTKTQAQQTDEAVDEALKKIQKLNEEIENMKNIDVATLNKFEAKLNEAEKALVESNLHHKLKILKAERHEQEELINQYALEIAALEYQVSVIKGNAESLEKRCFKRTRLEP